MLTWWRGRDDSKHSEGFGVERINGFSDAVFAVAITLLILTIVVPEVSNADQLGQELIDMWPKFMGFLISFHRHLLLEHRRLPLFLPRAHPRQ